MAQHRRSLRITEPPRDTRIDDQFWPLAVALVVLGGFLAGSVLAYLRLDDPRWFANAWTWLLAIPLGIGAALVTLAATGNRLLRRTMQLALVLGILFHVVLLIVSLQTDVFRRAWVEALASAQRQPEKKSVAVPDYASWQHDPQRRATRDFEQPVDVRPPDPQRDPEPNRPEPEEPEPPRAEHQPRPVPEPEEAPRPNVVKRPEPNQSNPRQRDETSQLSRKVAALPQRSTQAVSLPDVLPRPDRRPDSPRPEAVGLPTPVREAEAVVEPTRPRAESPEPVPSQQWSRRERNAEPTPEDPPAAAVARRENRPAIAPRAEADESGQPAAPRRSELEVPQPHNIAARKQETRAPETREAIETPPREEARRAALARRDTQQPAPPRDTLAQTPRSAFNQQPRVTQRPDVAPITDAMAQSAQRARRPAEATPLGPLPQRVSPAAKDATASDPSPAKTGPLASSVTTNNPVEASGNRAEAQRQLSADTSGAAAVNQIAVRQPQQTAGPAAPSLNPRPDRDRPRRRADRESDAASSPVLAESPTRTPDATRQPNTAAGPAAMALSKSDAGVAGRGVSQNLGHADPLADSPAAVASGAAQRAAAAQKLPAGPALAPQDAAIVRHARASQLRPSAILHATPLNPARVTGSAQPAELSASSSAALTQAASNAERGEVTAAKGSLDVDTGPTTLVAERGAGRAGGGGQPQLMAGTSRGPLASAPRESAPLPALLTDNQSATVAAPASDGGGSPQRAELDANATALVDARPDPTPADILGGPSAAAGGQEPVASLSPTPATRRSWDAADQTEPTTAADQAIRVARKAARDGQLAVDRGTFDLSAGNAADRSEDDERSPSMAVHAAETSPSERLTADGAVGSDRPQSDAALDEDAAAEARVTPLAARGEAVDAPPDIPVVGGGTSAPPRTPRGPALVAREWSEAVAVAGAPYSSGQPDAQPRSTQGLAANERASGVNLTRTSQPIAAAGTRHSEIVSDSPLVSVPGFGLSENARPPSAVDGPVAQAEITRGGPGKRSPRIELADVVAGDATQATLPSASTAWEPGTEEGLLAGDPNMGPVSRLAGPAMSVEIQAPVGVGGLDRSVTVEVGVASRAVADLSTDVQLETTRFMRNRVGGQPDFNTAAAMPTDSFRRRVARAEGSGAPADSAGPQTEEAIELGLVFLSRAQLADGRWTLDRFSREDGLPQLASDSAATGLALLAFQGAGYTHRDFRYADVVRRGVEFLLQNQQADGSLFIPMDDESNRVVQFYSHSIAALALCEAYGMTQDSTLREPAQRAINFIVQTQNPQRGGWRYTTGVSSDTSVTGWMMMALKSGELANLDVPADTYRQIQRWLDSAQASRTQPHLYCYNPFAPQDSAEQRAGRRPTTTMTSVGLLMRLYFGWRRDNPAMARGAQYLAQFPPAIGTASNPQRDTYYWYYATQVMFHMGGQHWREWNRQLHPLLVGAQLREGPLAGSWDPQKPVPDRWGPFAGRLYVTTMNLLSLEVTYRHLPLYEDTAK